MLLVVRFWELGNINLINKNDLKGYVSLGILWQNFPISPLVKNFSPNYLHMVLLSSHHVPLVDFTMGHTPTGLALGL